MPKHDPSCMRAKETISVHLLIKDQGYGNTVCKKNNLSLLACRACNNKSTIEPFGVEEGGFDDG